MAYTFPDCGAPWEPGDCCPPPIDDCVHRIPKQVMEKLNKFGTNGFVISGTIMWFQVQRKTNPEGIWKLKAERHWNDNKIKEAKDALAAAIPEDRRTGTAWTDIKKARNKKDLAIEDIKKMFELLESEGALPLILALSDQAT